MILLKITSSTLLQTIRNALASAVTKTPKHHHIITPVGPSIKYVTLFLANFDPLPLSHFVTHQGTPQRTSHISGPRPIFSRPSAKKPDKSPMYKFSFNCLWGSLSGGFVRGSFVWKVLSRMVFVHSPICQNTSVTTEM